MGDLTLTGLDEVLLEKLSQRAQEHGRSVEAEAADIITRQVSEFAADVWERLAETRRKQAGSASIWSISSKKVAMSADDCV